MRMLSTIWIEVGLLVKGLRSLVGSKKRDIELVCQVKMKRLRQLKKYISKINRLQYSFSSNQRISP